MGSSSAKRFSLRSIFRSAAALIFLVLLLVIAGGVSTLHHRDSGVVVRVNDRLLPRKILRLEVIEESASSSIDFATTNQQQHRPPAPALPRGLVHETTNLEMEPSLAGDPERRMHAPPTKKSLLAVPVGIRNKAVVDKLVSKFFAAAADFAVMLFHYDGAVEQWGDDLEWFHRAVHVAAKGQTKWWFAKRFLHPDVVADYDYVFLWDEDIEVDAFDPGRYLDVVRREALEVSQPALDRRSEIHHAITARALLPTPDGVHRRARSTRCGVVDGDGDDDGGGPPCVGWVEVMVPVFSRAAWRCAWGMLQNDLIHGWGLDYRLGYCAQGDRALNVGVVDSEYVLHRGVPMLGDGGTAAATTSAGRAAVRLRSFKEMQVFNRRWEVAAKEDDSWTDPYIRSGSSRSSDSKVKSSR